MNLNLDLNSIDFKNTGSWPFPAKVGVAALVCVVVLIAGYYLDIEGQEQILEQKQSMETTLKKDFETKQAKAASLDAYRAQMKEMEESFGTMLRQLPNKNEVADLLSDITQTGLASGLEFELFQPKAEITKDFFAELPINVQVTGNYHEFGEFVSGVAALPRIVTLQDIAIKKVKSGGRSANLVMQATAMTYRYLDPNEIAAAQAASRKNVRGRHRTPTPTRH